MFKINTQITAAIWSLIFLSSCVLKPEQAEIDKPYQTDWKDFSSLVFHLIQKYKIFDRDSGKNVDVSFLQSCLKESSPTYAHFECDDLTFPHFASQFGGAKEKMVLIIEDGASVENRYLYKVSGTAVTPLNFEEHLALTPSQIAHQTQKAFNESKYDEAYFQSSAHSSFRMQLPRNGETFIQLMSGVYDKASIPMGKLKWRGTKLYLVSQ